MHCDAQAWLLMVGTKGASPDDVYCCDCAHTAACHLDAETRARRACRPVRAAAP